MKVLITGKNFNPNDKLKATIENKLSKLDKYFSKDVEATFTKFQFNPSKILL